jgi:hypothetical protein
MVGDGVGVRARSVLTRGRYFPLRVFAEARSLSEHFLGRSGRLRGVESPIKAIMATTKRDG